MGQDFTAEIERLVAGLESLHDGDKYESQLIAMGQAAIEPVRTYLLRGRPSSTFQPRCRAVEVLGALGAKAALLDYIRSRTNIPDPLIRFGERAVESTAIRELSTWRDDDVFLVLMQLAEQHLSAALIDTLATFKRPESLRHIIRGLEFDDCRLAAIAALRHFSDASRHRLLQAAIDHFPDAATESPSSRMRRLNAIRLTMQMPPIEEEMPVLESLFKDDDSDIAVAAIAAAARHQDSSLRQHAAKSLEELLPSLRGSPPEDLELAVRRLATEIAPGILCEVRNREVRQLENRLFDPVLLVLRRVTADFRSSR